MKKVSLVLLALLFSASMASAETFTVKAMNQGKDANNNQTTIESVVETKTFAKILGPNINRANNDVTKNLINNTVIGAKAFKSVDVDVDCVACDDKFYDTVVIESDNHGDLVTDTKTHSTVGHVSKNQINGAVVGAIAGGTYKTTSVTGGIPASGTPVATSFKVTATNHGLDNDNTQTKIISTVTTSTTSETKGSGTPAPTTFIGGDVDDNTIDNLAFGANAFMDVEVDIECDCADKFYQDVDVLAENFGDVDAITNTFSDVGNVSNNRISATAIGANASGSYANINRSTPN